MRRLFLTLTLVVVLGIFLTPASAEAACNGVCELKPDGCGECDFSFCSNCWCVYFPMCQCETWVCETGAGNEGPSLEAFVAEDPIRDLVSNGRAAAVSEVPVVPGKDSRIRSRELSPRT